MRKFWAHKRQGGGWYSKYSLLCFLVNIKYKIYRSRIHIYSLNDKGLVKETKVCYFIVVYPSTPSWGLSVMLFCGKSVVRSTSSMFGWLYYFKKKGGHKKAWHLIPNWLYVIYETIQKYIQLSVGAIYIALLKSSIPC